MKRLTILLLFLSFFVTAQGCSGTPDKKDDLITVATKMSESTTSIDQNVVLATTTQFDYSRLDYSQDEPDFLFETEDNSKLSTDWRDDLLSELRLAAPNFDVPYVREEWGPGWIDDNYNCINTRHEVLIEESLATTSLDDRGCSVIAGKWYDYYSDEFFDDPAKLDIDHMVPLHNAHVSGASNWPLETKINFYNDLSDPQHLIAVSSSANRSKGSRGPEVWKPVNDAYWCQYAYSWIEIKARWNLSVSEIELQALQEMLNSCKGLPEQTYWFSNWLLRKGAMSTQDMSLTENEEKSELEGSFEETVDTNND